MSQPRKPRGTPDGGQFDGNRHEEADLELEDPSDVGWTGPQDECPVPQANRPAVLAGVVDAISAGCCTSDEVAEALGMDRRQGAYYTSAAEHLGLIQDLGDAREHFWDTTPLGRITAQTDGEDRVVAMAQIMEDSEYVQAYLNGDAKAVRKICEDHGLSGQTVQRRLSTVKMWADFVTAPDNSERRDVANQLVAIRSRSSDVIRNRPVAPVAAKCPGCNINLPAASQDECDACGMALSA